MYACPHYYLIPSHNIIHHIVLSRINGNRNITNKQTDDDNTSTDNTFNVRNMNTNSDDCCTHSTSNDNDTGNIGDAWNYSF